MNSDFINVSKMGLSNKKKLFNIIRYNPGITRREIARIAGMNPSSVTNITNSLKEMGLITEEGTKKSPQPGRNSIRLEAIKEAAIVFVFHMGVEQTIFGIGYLNNMIELKEEFETEKDTEHFFDKVSEISKKYIREIGRKPVGIYFSLPGLVDRKNGVIYTLPNVGWKNIDVKAEIEKRMGNHGLDIQIFNETKVSLKSEKIINPEIEQLGNGIYLYLSVGVGGALLIDHKVYHGSAYNAGEFGHMSINDDGPLCHCGKRGCLEAYIGAEKIVKHYEVNGNLNGENTEEKFKSLMEFYRLNDAEARKIIDEMLGYLIHGIRNLIHIFNPDFFVIGGLGRDFTKENFDFIRKEVTGDTSFPVFRNVLIIPSRESIEQSALHGCTLEAMDSYVNRFVV
ncbi:MAG TPA: ROK family transcriptional regulator [Thermotogota bacterium]|nr:ROK family transcriptional regulator [Thermotogota bacterium]HPJ88399.1 ROK family transcriptional regulator [Thermotogota bacterium]HPR95434.1 ROK family transcriptional regulator [Thermotogota bacterium]